MLITAHHSKVLYGLYVNLVLFHFLSKSDCLLYFSWIDVLRPATLSVINTSALSFKSLCVDLNEVNTIMTTDRMLTQAEAECHFAKGSCVCCT